MSRLPSKVRTEISRIILQRAVEIHWDDLLFSDRSRKYEEWMSDPEIGGRILKYMAREKARVWIKDGPMKEYARAKRGLGPYAILLDAAMNYEGAITTKVYGNKWKVVPDSIKTKPATFSVTDGDSIQVVFWGTTKELKHLIWAWLNCSCGTDCRIVILSTSMNPVTADMQIKYARIAQKLGTIFTYAAF